MHRNRNNRYEDGTQGTRHTYTMLLLFERERTKTKILRTKNMQTCASAHSFSYKLCLVWTRLKHRKTKNYKYSCIFGCLFFGYALDVYFRDAIASEECSSGYGNDVRAQREESVHKFHGIYCVELASSHCLFIRRKKKRNIQREANTKQNMDLCATLYNPSVSTSLFAVRCSTRSCIVCWVAFFPN